MTENTKAPRSYIIENPNAEFSDTFLKELGRIAYEYELLQFILRRLLVALHPEGEDAGNSEAYMLNADNICSQIRFYYDQKFPMLTLPSEVENALGRVETVSVDRNKFMHSVWMIDSYSKSLGRIKPMLSKKNEAGKQELLNIEPEEHHIEEIKNLALSMLGTSAPLARFWQSLGSDEK